MYNYIDDDKSSEEQQKSRHQIHIEMQALI